MHTKRMYSRQGRETGGTAPYGVYAGILESRELSAAGKDLVVYVRENIGFLLRSGQPFGVDRVAAHVLIDQVKVMDMFLEAVLGVSD